jgi:hypothetical protein
MTPEEFRQIENPATGKPYKRCSDCRRKDHEGRARAEVKRMQRLTSLTEEERSRYCKECDQVKESLKEFTRLSKKCNTIVVSNRCNGCYECGLRYSQVDGFRCPRSEGGCKAVLKTKEELAAHEQLCKWEPPCHHCGAKFRKGKKDQHVGLCLSRRCRSCSRRIKLELFEDHKAGCQQEVHDKRVALERKRMCAYLTYLCSTPCKNTPVDECGFCQKHIRQHSGRGKNSVAEQRRLLGIFFSKRGQSAVQKIR